MKGLEGLKGWGDVKGCREGRAPGPSQKAAQPRAQIGCWRKGGVGWSGVGWGGLRMGSASSLHCTV